MNDIPEPAARPEAGGAKAETTEEGPSSSPSQSTPPAAAAEAPADRPSFFERLAGLFRQKNGSSLREEIADALAETDDRRRILLARRAGDAPQHPAAARGARRGRDDPARRHRGGRDRHHARRADDGVRAVRPFAHAGLFRDARRPARHGPYPRRARPHHQARPRQEGPRHAQGCRCRRSISPMSICPRRSASST